jgi:hypothetical protein
MKLDFALASTELDSIPNATKLIEVGNRYDGILFDNPLDRGRRRVGCILAGSRFTLAKQEIGVWNSQQADHITDL